MPARRVLELERLDHWLRVSSAWRLRWWALLIALAMNAPNAWLLYRAVYAPTADFPAVALPAPQEQR